MFNKITSRDSPNVVAKQWHWRHVLGKPHVCNICLWVAFNNVVTFEVWVSMCAVSVSHLHCTCIILNTVAYVSKSFLTAITWPFNVYISNKLASKKYIVLKKNICAHIQYVHLAAVLLLCTASPTIEITWTLVLDAEKCPSPTKEKAHVMICMLFLWQTGPKACCICSDASGTLFITWTCALSAWSFCLISSTEKRTKAHLKFTVALSTSLTSLICLMRRECIFMKGSTITLSHGPIGNWGVQRRKMKVKWGVRLRECTFRKACLPVAKGRRILMPCVSYILSLKLFWWLRCKLRCMYSFNLLQSIFLVIFSKRLVGNFRFLRVLLLISKFYMNKIRILKGVTVAGECLAYFIYRRADWIHIGICHAPVLELWRQYPMLCFECMFWLLLCVCCTVLSYLRCRILSASGLSNTVSSGFYEDYLKPFHTAILNWTLPFRSGTVYVSFPLLRAYVRLI